MIDFLITWVDGHDPIWMKERNHYAALAHNEIDVDEIRYRNWENLRYWFRGVEKFAPWVNKIFFVTCGHLPEWLNTGHPKLEIVNHSDFIPAEYLPTFNSNVIELYFHRIKGLSEQFVYFNDDMFLIDSVLPSRFFRRGLPCDKGGFTIHPRNGMFGTAVYLAIQLINAHFNKKETVLKALPKWFTLRYPRQSLRSLLYASIKRNEFLGFFDPHLPQGYLKDTYEEVWANCSEDLIRTSKSHFRQYGDVTSWLLRYWQLASNTFFPYNTSNDGQFYFLDKRNIAEIIDCIRHQRKKIVCLNDMAETTVFDYLKNEILTALESILPDKCTFELS